MKLAIDAVFENGAFRPIDTGDLSFSDGQRVRLTVDDDRAADPLELAKNVYEGLSRAQIDEIERVALDRSAFFGHRGFH